MARITLTEGPYAGWMTWTGGREQRFSQAALGQMYFRDEPDGRSVRCVMETANRHTNDGGFLHGGFLMGFADMVYYAVAWKSLRQVRAITLTSNFEFLDAGLPGTLLEASGEVMRETGKLIFIRAVIEQGRKPLVSMSGVLRKVPVKTMDEGDA